MAIDSTRLLELTKFVLSTPQGLFAALVALSSTVALIYLFLTKTTQPSGKTVSRSKSNPTKSSPAKQTSAATKKSSPKKTSSSPKKDTPNKATASSSTKASNAKSSAADKRGPTDKKATASTKTTSGKSRQTNGVSKSSQNKDDGEWITVSSKKKTLRTKKTDEAPSAPQTRMSTRRSNQNSQTPKRI